MLTRVANSALFGMNVGSIMKPPDLLNAEWLTSVNAAGTDVVNIARVNSSDVVEINAGAIATTSTITTLTTTRVLGGTVVQAVSATVTLAQINAGFTLVAAVAGQTLTPVGFRVKCTGAFAALTDIRLSDTNSSPVDIATIAQAQATDGAIFTENGASGLTFGAGFGAALTAAKGIQIRKTGSTGTTATGCDVIVFYIAN
jgi:hypothetical protein